MPVSSLCTFPLKVKSLSKMVTFPQSGSRSPGKRWERILGLRGTCQRETDGQPLAECTGHIQSSANFKSHHSFLSCFSISKWEGRGGENELSYHWLLRIAITTGKVERRAPENFDSDLPLTDSRVSQFLLL